MYIYFITLLFIFDSQPKYKIKILFSYYIYRYFDKLSGRVESTFWELYNVYNEDNPTSASAENLYNGLIKTFSEYQIPITNIIGFGSDGCNSMMGQYNSVASRFHNACPNIFIAKCVCHSAHLCASAACKVLPRNCEDLARNIFNHFKQSAKRQSEFKQFQSFLDISPHKMLHPSQTRWLSLSAVISRILEQWDALKLYFTDNYLAQRLISIEHTYMALNNPFAKIYYYFLDWVLPKFNKYSLF